MNWRKSIRFGHWSSLVVIHNFHIVRITVAPHEAYAKLVIDADAVLSFPLSFERFQTIARRGSQITELGCDVQLPKLPLGYPREGPETLHPLPGMQLLRVRRAKGLDHPLAYNVWR